ncbi:hypothetical protein Tco_1035666, partial [Tanacetum coccineum]
RGDDDPEETIAKDVSEVDVEKTKKKRKRKAAGDASGSTLPPKKLREDYHAATSNVGGKSLAAICGLILEGSFIPSRVTEPLVVASVTPTPDGGSPTADASVMTVAVTTTIAANVSAVLIPNVKAGANVAGTLKLNEPATSSDSFYASQDLDSETLHNIYVPKWTVINDSVLSDSYVCHDLTIRLAPFALFSQLCAMYYDQLYTEFNVEVAWQMCLGVETALLSEKDAEIAHLKSLLSLREAEAAEAIRLRCQLSVVEAADAAKGNELRDLKERNFAREGEKYVLSEKVTTLEFVTALKETELAYITAQVVQLTSDLSGFLLSVYLQSYLVFIFVINDFSLIFFVEVIVRVCIRALKGRMEAMQDEQETILGNRVAELDAQLLEMGGHLEEEFYPRFLTAISGWRWILTHGLKLVLLKCLQSSEYLQALGQAIGCAINKGIRDGLKAGVDHGKAGRDLSVIESYDPSAEAKYVDSVSALRTMDFSLLSVLKCKKDASIVDLMNSLRLEGPLAEIPGAEELQPSPE